MSPMKPSTAEGRALRTIIGLERAALDRWERETRRGSSRSARPTSSTSTRAWTDALDGLEALKRYSEPPAEDLLRQIRAAEPAGAGRGRRRGADLQLRFLRERREAEPVERCTEVYRRSSGKWLIIQTHWSYTRSVRAVVAPPPTDQDPTCRKRAAAARPGDNLFHEELYAVTIYC